MKISSLNEQSFKPVELKITVETKQELDLLTHVFGANVDIADLLCREGYISYEKKQEVSEILGTIWDELYVET